MTNKQKQKLFLFALQKLIAIAITAICVATKTYGLLVVFLPVILYLLVTWKVVITL